MQRLSLNDIFRANTMPPKKQFANRGFVKSSFSFIDLFAGIGGFRIALDSIGGRCLAFSEIDKNCVETYLSNYEDSKYDNLGDITKINNIEQVDMLVGGVPCQSWSVAGKMLGFSDPRGALWHDVIRLVETSKPKTFIFENVKGLYDPRNKDNLNLLVNHFKKLGYLVDYNLLNSYDFGVPQIRSRVFVVGFRGDFPHCFHKFSFPEGTMEPKHLSEYLDGVEKRDILKKKFRPAELFGNYIPKARNAFQKEDELNDFFTMCDTRNGHTTIHSWELIETTSRQKEIMLGILKNRRRKIYGSKDGNPLTLGDIKSFVCDIAKHELEELVAKKLLRKIGDMYELVNSKNSSGINGVYRMYMPYSKVFSTLTASGTRDVVATDYIDPNLPPGEYKNEFLTKIFVNKKYRPLTTAETQRIQGFPNNFKPHPVEKIAKKQFGNAVSPPVIVALAEQIINTGIFSEVKQVG